MRIKNTYPSVEKGSGNRRRLLAILRWPFIAVALASLIVNLCVGDPWWSLIVLPTLYAVWSLVLSPDLVEYNRISQTIKGVFWASALLALIDVFLVNVYALFVIPIVCFGGMTGCIVLFFTDMERQKHNMLSLFIFIFVSIVGSAIALHFRHGAGSWPFIVLLSLSVAFLLSLIIVLGPDFRREIEKRFHIK